MNKNLLKIMIIMGALGVALIIEQGENDKYLIIYNAISVICISILQIAKSIFKINYKVVTVLQLLLSILLQYFKILGIVFLIPILIFELVQDKISLISAISVNVLLLMIFSRDNLVFSVIYLIIINLYLYKAKEQMQIRNELMESNRATRDERYLMNEKIINFNKYLEQSNVMTTLRERNYLAQKLHDHLGHRITSSLMQLEVTKEILDKDVQTSRKYLVSAMDNLREGMDEIRELLRNVKPRDRIIGIEDIRESLLKFQFDTGINTILNVNGDINKLSLGQLVIIETNITEGLTNAAKYSKATEIQITFNIYNKFARIEIRDNGIGCKLINKGLGVRGIEERMNSINGRVEFYSENGFVINMIVDLGD